MAETGSTAPKTQAEKAAQFRALHEREGPVLIPNPFDEGSARILEGLGYEALATTSAGLGFARGKVDGQVSEEEVLEHCRAVCRVTQVPVSADLAKGLGDSPESAAETVRAAASVGLAGCSLEDAPDVFSNKAFDDSLALERIQAAVEAKKALPHDFMLTARVEALGRGSQDVDGVIKRLQAFEAAGADVLYAPGMIDPEHIRTLCASVSRPVNILIGFRAMTMGLEELGALGVKRVSVGVMLARTAYSAVVKAARELQATGKAPDSSQEVRSNELAAFFL